MIKKSKDIVFCVEEDCKKWVLNELSSLHQNLKENTSSEGYRQRLNWWINHCQSVYNADIQSAEHVKQYKQKSSEYKDRFMNKVFANYSTVSRRSYTGYMNALHFDFPLPEQGVEQQLVDDIREEAIDTVSYSNNKIIDLMQDRERLADEYSVCPSPISTIGEGDFFDKMTNTIGVSHFSCRFHEHGKQTLAHELAHALSHWFGQNKPDLGKLNKPSKKSYAQYMKLRECANKRYKANNKSKPEIHVRFGHNNDQFRTEEDMADLIAYQVFQDDPTLVQCSLLVSSEDGSEYQFLRMLHPPLSKEGHEIADPHSTALLRTITEAIHKGKQLSPACRKIVSLYSDKINFDSCL